jgi:hypothetical protein
LSVTEFREAHEVKMEKSVVVEKSVVDLGRAKGEVSGRFFMPPALPNIWHSCTDGFSF